MPLVPTPASMIEAALGDVRRWINDPAVIAKYSDLVLVRQLALAFHRVVQDINSVDGPAPLILTFDVPVKAKSAEVLLPPTIGSILYVGIPAGSQSGRNELSAIFPQYSVHDIRGQNWRFVPPYLVFDSAFAADGTLRLLYAPGSCDFLLRGVVNYPSRFPANSTTRLTVSLSVIDVANPLGEIDPRPHGLTGYYIRFFSYTGGLPLGYDFPPWIERRIVSYDVATGLVTLNEPYPNLGGAITAVHFEVLPLLDNQVLALAALSTALRICNVEARSDRFRALSTEYKADIVALRRKFAERSRSLTQAYPTKLTSRESGSGLHPLTAPFSSVITG